jgi:molybdenum cofactor cytidylyltransferase
MPASGRAPVAALVLAAGRAERYGGEKLGEALPGGESVLAHTVRGLLAPEAGVDRVWVVTADRHRADAWLGGEDGLGSRVRWVEVSGAGGMGDSLAAGARAAPAGWALAVVLGDQPFAAPAAVGAVVEALGRSGRPDAVAVALRRGLAMPPAAFGPAWREELGRLTGDVGARALVGRAGATAQGVELGEGAWALDLDRPEDLAALWAAAQAPGGAAGRAGRP